MVALSHFRRRSFQHLLAVLPLVVSLLTATVPAYAACPLDLPSVWRRCGRYAGRGRRYR